MISSSDPPSLQQRVATKRCPQLLSAGIVYIPHQVLCCKIRIMEFKIMFPMIGLWAGLGSCACRETILLMDVNLVVRKGVDHDKVAVFLVVYWWLSSMQSETRYHFDSMNSNESWQKNPNSCWHEAHIVYGLKTQLTSSILFSVVWRCTGNPLALIAAGTHNRPSSSNGRGELTFCSKYFFYFFFITFK